jgi:cobaltochelatase CobN
MIVFVTTADTEILALSRVARDLPEGFPALKAVNPTRRPSELGPAELVAGAVMVLVRLLGGRRAWEEGFDALVRYCRQQGIPCCAYG